MCICPHRRTHTHNYNRNKTQGKGEEKMGWGTVEGGTDGGTTGMQIINLNFKKFKRDSLGYNNKKKSAHAK